MYRFSRGCGGEKEWSRRECQLQTEVKTAADGVGNTYNFFEVSSSPCPLQNLNLALQVGHGLLLQQLKRIVSHFYIVV